MSALTGAVSNVGGGGIFGKKGMKSIKAAIEARKAKGGRNAVIRGGGARSHTHDESGQVVQGGGTAMDTQMAEVTPEEREALASEVAAPEAASAIAYKMPAAGKYNNSPIEKNYGSPAQRGFHTPNKLKTFGVGDSNKEKMGGVGSNLLDK